MSMISRRDFLKLTGLATTAVALTACDDDEGTSASSETPTTPSEEVTQKTNNEINKSTTWTNGQTAKFGVYSHEATLACTVYEFYIDGIDEVFARVAETSFTIAAGAESEGDEDKTKTYMGKYAANGGKDGVTLEVLSDGKTDLVENKSDDVSSSDGFSYDTDDLSNVSAEDAVAAISEYVKDELKAAKEEETRTVVQDLTEHLDETIDQGGITNVSYVGLPYGGSPLAITAEFDNPYYMAKGCEVKYAFTASTKALTIYYDTEKDAVKIK